MKKSALSLLPASALTLALIAAISPITPHAFAQEAKSKDEETIEAVMKLCNKAPRGTPKLAEKVADGTATPEETQKVIDSYKTLKGTKPPKGDAAAWDKRVDALLAAIDALEKKQPGAAAKFKEANGCKACHTDHRPE
jgi:hypothetical protein